MLLPTATARYTTATPKKTLSSFGNPLVYQIPASVYMSVAFTRISPLGCFINGFFRHAYRPRLERKIKLLNPEARSSFLEAPTDILKPHEGKGGETQVF
jgi:hypothetical protein